MRHVVMFSGGAASWATAKRVAERHGTENLTLLFADTNTEDADLYRFLYEAAANVGGELVVLDNGGRNIWDVFRKERMLGSSRMDPCSKILKRQAADRWREENCERESSIHYVGIDWTERGRFDREPGTHSDTDPGGLKYQMAARGWRFEAPMIDPPYLTRADVFASMEAEGIERPRLYKLGFSHNNCGGGCVKAGHEHWEHLLLTLPDVFKGWEDREEAFRVWIGRTDATILRDRAGGDTRPLTLREFRERIQSGRRDLLDLFANESAEGCGGSCFYDPVLEAA